MYFLRILLDFRIYHYNFSYVLEKEEFIMQLLLGIAVATAFTGVCVGGSYLMSKIIK